MYSDPIADMLTRIRNGYMAKAGQVVIPHSKLKTAIAEVLKESQYLKEVSVQEENKKKTLVVELLYKQGKPAITKMIRISKAGRRVYQSKSKLPHVLSGLGIAIISNSKGVMTDKQARKQGLGGEIVCQVW